MKIFITMKIFIAMTIFLTLLLLLLLPSVSAADEATLDSSRDILVTFHSDRDRHLVANATDNARQPVFAALNSVDISRSGGDRYKVTVPLTVNSVAELQEFAEKVRSMPHVMSANVIALQLPIRSDE